MRGALLALLALALCAPAAGAQQATVEPAQTLEPPPEFIAVAGKDYSLRNGIPQTDHPLGLQEGPRTDDSFFDYAVFVGDSVSIKLRNYVTQMRKTEPKFLSNAQFLTVGSFSAKLALEDVSANSYHPKFKGKKMLVEDILAKSKARKVFIMLGMNDVGPSGVKGAVQDMMTLLGRIREKSPEIEIYVESATPRLSGGPPTTQQLFDYDLALYDAVLAKGDPKMHFVDVAYVMRDDEGKLFPEYCSDPEDLALHFTDAACQKWLDFLYTHT